MADVLVDFGLIDFFVVGGIDICVNDSVLNISISIGLDVSIYAAINVGLDIGAADADLDVYICVALCCLCCYCGLDFGIECSDNTVMVQLLQ